MNSPAAANKCTQGRQRRRQRAHHGHGGHWAVRAAMVALAALLVAVAAPAAQAMAAEGGAVPANSRAYGPTVRQLVQGAKSSIVLQLYQARYYPEYPNTITNRFVDDLIGAAKRGVDVRIVIDTGDWNQGNKNEYNLAFVDLLTTAGVKVWQDNPRDVSHQKVMCVDGRLCLVASTNWSFMSLERNNEVGVVLESAELGSYVTRYFYERVAAGTPLHNAQAVAGEADITRQVNEAAERAAAGEGRGGKGRATLSSALGKAGLACEAVEPLDNRKFYPGVREAILSASRSIDVVQASINLYNQRPRVGSAAMRQGEGADGDGGPRPQPTPVPAASLSEADVRAPFPEEPPSETNALVELLKGAARRGVKVRVVLDQSEIRDNAENYATAAALQQAGIEAYLDSPTTQTHTKMLLVDGHDSIIGSTNWTFPALEKGNEFSVRVRSEALGAVYKSYVDDIVKTAVLMKPGMTAPPAPRRGSRGE